ncbi:MAG: PQQ-dependent sugar dehydrogenase [Phycisphaerae bacterium]
MRRFAASSILALALTEIALADTVHDDRLAISTFATGLKEPVAIEFAPDGRLFIAEVGGKVRVASADGVVDPAPVASIEVFTANENGLLGLALDPDFATNGYIYVFATIDPKEQQILRMIDPAKRQSEADAQPFVLRDHLPTRGEFHSGGGLEIGPDKKLYFGIGDNLVRENSQDMNTLAGKISRINLDGTTPSDNPFKTASGSPRAVYALGLRNPFRFCFAPDGRLFAMDVGSDNEERREEINLIRPGDNCGWPLFEGKQSEPIDPAYVDPIFDYHDGGAAPVGCVFYTGDGLPEEYVGILFHLEFVLGRLYRTVLDGDTVINHTTLLESEGGPVDLTVGPDGALYYSELYTGEIKRLGPPATSVAGNGVSEPSVDADSSTDEVVQPASLCGFGAWLSSLAVVGLAARRGRV